MGSEKKDKLGTLLAEAEGHIRELVRIESLVRSCQESGLVTEEKAKEVLDVFRCMRCDWAGELSRLDQLYRRLKDDVEE